MARPFSHPAAKDISLDAILHALSEPVRREILYKLMGCDSNNGMNCSKAACDTLAPSTLSFHYKVMREAGLIHSEKKGVEVINTVRREDIEKRFPGLLHSIYQHHKPLKK